MSRNVVWINPYMTETYMVPEGTKMPDGSAADDSGALVIEHEDDLMLCMDSPLDVREFLRGALAEVEAYIESNGL